ncbi:MAG: hypothetical protein AB8F94_15380 [Saprospiraceae bacterium]
MKKILILLLIFSSCSPEELEDNQFLIDKIDKKGYSECLVKLEIDSLGNIIDTIDITKKKLDGDDKLIFKKRIYNFNKKKYITKTYYWEDGTDFLSISESESKDSKNYSEILRTKSNKLKRLITYSEFDGEIDTLIMDYKFDYSIFGRKKRLTLKLNSKEENSSYIIEYNQDEKAKTEMTIIELDTFERKNYFYTNHKLVKIEKYKQSLDTFLTVHFFNEHEKNDSTLDFSITNAKKKLNYRIVYNYDTNSVYKGYEEIDLKNGKKRKVILKKKSCD